MGLIIPSSQRRAASSVRGMSSVPRDSPIRPGQSEAAQSPATGDAYLDDLELVTAEDVRRACAKYLVERNRTVGWFIPEGESR
jgi:predicted Zn-dependent peptidase